MTGVQTCALPISDRAALSVLADLLTNIDMTRRDIYWLIKDIREDNIYYMENRG